jgi:aerobic carbon-monoxide dehydrogenase small subunit
VVRKALVDKVSFQCGYCAPSFAIALTALFMSGQRPDAESIKAALEGNIYRCTGCVSIIRGAQRAREVLFPE